MATITVQFRMAWWFRPYASCLAFFWGVTGLEPDWDKFELVVKRALITRVVAK